MPQLNTSTHQMGPAAADRVPEGLLTPYLRRRRIAMVQPHLRGSVLDIGCSAGPMADLIGPQSYVGFDINRAVIDRARERHPQHRFCTELPDDKTFDTVIALAVIEHLEDPARELAAWKSALKADGTMVLTTPHPWSRRVHDLGAKLGVFSRHASEDHEEFIDHDRMRALAAQAGLEVSAYRRFLFGGNQLFVLRARTTAADGAGLPSC